MSTWLMFGFQDSNSPYADNLIVFHNLIMMVMTSIVVFTGLVFLNICNNTMTNRYFLKNHFLEIVWTVIPIFVLLIICFPSLKILYYIDEVLNPYFTIKVIGHQWYWSYFYPEFSDVNFDSYMLTDMDLDLSGFRLLDVDNRMVVPMNFPIRMVLTSDDVIHSWAVQSLGIKVDVIPGRINQANLYCFRPGVFFGQCSEICGMNHSFMPIVIESTSFLYFNNWLYSH
uniref:Cytochrome c oxidase subunit 2 n=1 Tax=Amegilla calceifera TaxID=597987 RepID=A0A7U0M7T2_9HYME|nr:cytochrome c oxidase subunit II [Amegilla calceifera]QQX28001.1 cytochrome c oxidase subunit 2 [Amegilla calceifera]